MGRPLKPEAKKRRKVGLTLAPESIAFLPLIAEKLGIDANSRVVDELIKKEARRLRIK